jgi:hypothetical protein
MKIFALLLLAFAISSCASNPKAKYAEKVGCTEEEATVIQDSSAALVYESYTVQCKGKTYKCTETALGTSNCSQQKK